MDKLIDPRNPPEHYYRVPAYYRKHRPIPRVRIGAAWSPKVQVQPALYLPAPKGPKIRRIVYDCLMLVGAVATLAFLASVGAAVGY